MFLVFQLEEWIKLFMENLYRSEIDRILFRRGPLLNLTVIFIENVKILRKYCVNSEKLRLATLATINYHPIF